MGLSKFFTENSLMHYHIVFIPRTHKKCFPLISRCVDSFTLAFDLWVIWQQQQCRNSLSFAALFWSNSAAARRS